MKKKEVLEKLHRIIEMLKNAPSAFLQEFEIDYDRANEGNIINQIDIIVEIIVRELSEHNLTADNVKEIIQDETDEECKALLVAATRDNEFIKEYVRNNKISQLLVNKLAILTGERSFIKECIDSSENNTNIKIELIEQMGAEYIIGYLKNPGRDVITLYDRIRLACATHDSKYIQHFIKTIPPIGDRYLLQLILATNDEEYIIRKLRQGTISDGYRLIAIKELIKKSPNSKALKSYIDEIRRELDEEGKYALLVLLNEFEDILHKGNIQGQSRPKITLPKDMTIGIEIESVGRYAQTFQHRYLMKWRAKSDSSLSDPKHNEYDGLEVVSPVLCNNGDMEDELENVCAILKGLGQKTNASCGAHVHIGADYLSNSEALRVFLSLIEDLEDLIYIISNEEGTIPRSGIDTYAEPFTSMLNRKMECESINLNDEDELDSLIAEIHKVQKSNRHVGINFYNLGLRRNTIEFRMANGTLNSVQWIENINLYGGLIKVAQEIMTILSKNKDERSEEEKKKLLLFNSLPTLDDEARLNAMLELAVVGDKTPYISRYRTNRQLIDKQNASFDKLFVLKQGIIELRGDEYR